MNGLISWRYGDIDRADKQIEEVFQTVLYGNGIRRDRAVNLTELA